jgi:hypothetical protein
VLYRGGRRAFKRVPATLASGLHHVCPELRSGLDAESGTFRQLVKAVRAAHSRAHPAQVGVETSVPVLVVRSLGQRDGGVQARSLKNAHADRRMRRDTDRVLGCEPPERDQLRQTVLGASAWTKLTQSTGQLQLDPEPSRCRWSRSHMARRRASAALGTDANATYNSRSDRFARADISP